jgi:cell division protein FtsI (penicillin-binding protein 3)
MLGRTDRRGRLVAVLTVFVLLASLAGARLAYWQVAAQDQLVGIAQQQLERQVVEPAARGSIYDRTGVLLATTVYRDQLVAYPNQIAAPDRAPMAAALASILGLDAQASAALAAQLESNASYAVLANQLTSAQSQAVQDGLDRGSLSELGLLPQPVRIYPNPGGAPDTTLASQLLGFVNDAGQGQYGVEQRYQPLLAGQPRVAMAEQDFAGRPMAGTEVVSSPGSPGEDLRLTLDAGLQLAVEKELNAAWIADGATRASAIVMDAATGAVLAWGSEPGYDANNYQAVARTSPGAFVDPLISQVYEPGSVMKMFTATAAIGQKVVTPTTLINDSGVMQVGNVQIADADRRPMGMIPFEKVIAYSRNVGAARVARMLGSTVNSASASLYASWIRMGIGQPTGVDLTGELPGLVTNPAVVPWSPVDLANHAFGQGVAVTLAQLARGYAAMVNGGWLVEPHVVDEVGSRPAQIPPPQRVMSAELSSTLTRMMRYTVTTVPWYAAWTLIPGYDVGGKTGTAQIWDPRIGNWLSTQFDFTFVGYLGRQRPELIIAVEIDHGRPDILAQGVFQQNITSNELFRRIGRDAIQALDLAPLPRTAAGASASPLVSGTGTPWSGEVPAPTATPAAP